MDIIITLKAEPKLLKAIDALVECLQAQGVLATSLTTFEPQTGTTAEPLPGTVPEQHGINTLAEHIGCITRMLHPQATGTTVHDVGPVDEYINSVMLNFLHARGLNHFSELEAAEDIDALLYTLQGAAAQKAAQQALAAPTFPVPSAPITPIAPQQPVYQTPVQAPIPTYQAPAAPPIQVYQAPIAPAVPAPIAPLPTAAPTYSMDQLAVSATGLVDTGKVGELMTLLGQYGCQALTQLPVEQYGNFATALRGLGAQI